MFNLVLPDNNRSSFKTHVDAGSVIQMLDIICQNQIKEITILSKTIIVSPWKSIRLPFLTPILFTFLYLQKCVCVSVIK